MLTVLTVLWAAFAASTAGAYAVVVVTGRYPRALFGFNVGVLRWTWRVLYYGYVVLGTDRYPPFTLRDDADYPARLAVDHALTRPRWLPLVAWLLVVPHALILGGMLNTQLVRTIRIDAVSIPLPVGVSTIGITVVASQLAITGRHPRGLYDLFTGVARWLFRAVAFVTLLTGTYPPFRLDQGGAEPVGPADWEQGGTANRTSTVNLKEER